MKRLLLLTMLMVVTISSAGCCGQLRNWWHRGASCGNVYEPACGCDAAPLAQGPLYAPSIGTVPGPIETVPARP